MILGAGSKTCRGWHLCHQLLCWTYAPWEWLAGNISFLFARGTFILTEDKKLWNKWMCNRRITHVSQQVMELFFGGCRAWTLKLTWCKLPLIFIHKMGSACWWCPGLRWASSPSKLPEHSAFLHGLVSLGLVPLGAFSTGKVRSWCLWWLLGFERGMCSCSLYFYSLLFFPLQGLSTLYCLLKWVLMESSLLFLNPWFFLLVPNYFNAAGLFHVLCLLPLDL